MSNRNPRRKTALGALVIAAVLSLASASFACTTFKGKMTATANAVGTVLPGDPSPGGSVSAVGDDFGMGHCQPNGNPTGTANMAIDGGSLNISVVAQGCGTGSTGTLAQGDYSVNYFPRYPAATTVTDCMNPSVAGGQGIQMLNASGGLAVLTVTSTGSGSGGPYSLPAYATRAPGPVSICITSPLGVAAQGMMVPVYIV